MFHSLRIPQFSNRSAGLLIALPVIAVALVGTVAATQPIDPPRSAPAAAERGAVTPVNRAGKGDRLPMAARAVPSRLATVENTPDAAGSVVVKGEEQPRPSRTIDNLPRGCLSAVGGLRTKVGSREEFTICLADASMVQ